MHIAIIGAGASGVLTFHHIVKAIGNAPGDVSIDIYERAPSQWARGLAYSTPHDHHILNMRAETMSHDSQNPSELVRWMGKNEQELDAYPPRHMYGRFLSNIFAAAMADAAHDGILVDRFDADVQQCSYEHNSFLVGTRNNETRVYDRVILAQGELPSQRFAHLHRAAGFISSPWAREMEDASSNSGQVGILGAGLTAVDAALTLTRQDYGAPLHFLTRNRYLPRVQSQPAKYEPKFLNRSEFERCASSEKNGLITPRTLASLVRAEFVSAFGEVPDHPFEQIRYRSQLADLEAAFAEASYGQLTTWHVLDSTGTESPEMWNLLSPEAKDLLCGPNYSAWSMVRHCMPFNTAEHLLTHGREVGIETTTGVKSVSYDSCRQAFHVSTHESSLWFDTLIDATGAALSITDTSDALIHGLLDQGLVTPSPYGGVDVNFDTCETAPGSHLYAIGPMTRGTHFYTNSIETTARNARVIANHINTEIRENS